MRRFTALDAAFPSEAALKLLNVRFSGRWMLPKLQDARWINAPRELVEPMLTLIVSPALTNFQLGLNVYDPLNALEVVPVFKALAPAYNSLVEIRICNPTINDPQIIHATSALLLGCNPDKLLYFHVDSTLSAAAFIYATQLPSLKAFFMRADPTELSKPLPASMFPSLRSLQIRVADVTGNHSPLTETIARIRSDTFMHLDLEIPAVTVGTFLPPMLAALRPRGLHQTLTSLSIAPKGDFNLDTATIQPLLFLNQLTFLDIQMLCGQDRCPYKLSDKNLEDLVRAMPKLSSLSLGAVPCSQPASTTMKSLVSIAKYCKHLEDLIIHTNIEAIVGGVFEREARGEHPTPDAPIPTFTQCPLRNIIFGPCFIPRGQRGAMAFALTLLRLFPRLVIVTTLLQTTDQTTEMGPQWEMIDDIILTDRRMRANIVEAGKFTGLFPHKNFAHVLQPLVLVTTKQLFLDLPAPWTPSVFNLPSGLLRGFLRPVRANAQ